MAYKALSRPPPRHVWLRPTGEDLSLFSRLVDFVRYSKAPKESDSLATMTRDHGARCDLGLVNRLSTHHGALASVDLRFVARPRYGVAFSQIFTRPAYAHRYSVSLPRIVPKGRSFPSGRCLLLRHGATDGLRHRPAGAPAPFTVEPPSRPLPDANRIDLSGAPRVAEVEIRGFTLLVDSEQRNLRSCHAAGCDSLPEVEVRFWEAEFRFDSDTHRRAWTFCRPCAGRLQQLGDR